MNVNGLNHKNRHFTSGELCTCHISIITTEFDGESHSALYTTTSVVCHSECKSGPKTLRRRRDVGHRRHKNTLRPARRRVHESFVRSRWSVSERANSDQLAPFSAPTTAPETPPSLRRHCRLRRRRPRCRRLSPTAARLCVAYRVRTHITAHAGRASKYTCTPSCAYTHTRVVCQSVRIS